MAAGVGRLVGKEPLVGRRAEGVGGLVGKEPLVGRRAAGVGGLVGKEGSRCGRAGGEGQCHGSRGLKAQHNTAAFPLSPKLVPGSGRKATKITSVDSSP
eukprot:363650-Chlamydomonas_euryale.AAC.6